MAGYSVENWVDAMVLLMAASKVALMVPWWVRRKVDLRESMMEMTMEYVSELLMVGCSGLLLGRSQVAKMAARLAVCLAAKLAKRSAAAMVELKGHD